MNTNIFSINMELDDLLWRYYKLFKKMPDDIIRYLYPIIDNLADAGIRRINWRTMIGGKALYHSKIVQRFNGGYSLYQEAEAELLEQCDPLKLVIEYAKPKGIDVWCWMDAFDYYVPGLDAQMFISHPSWWLVSRDGQNILPGVPCYAKKAVREYFGSQMQELAKYDIGGIVYSLFNSHASPYLVGHLKKTDDGAPYSYGYNDEIIEEFKHRYGVDICNEEFDIELWSSLQAEQFSDYLQQCRKILSSENKKLELVIRRDNHCAGTQYPACYIANDYKLWWNDGCADALIIEGVTLENGWNRAMEMAEEFPEASWGIWHTIWETSATARPPLQTQRLLDEIRKNKHFNTVLLHETDTLEFLYYTYENRKKAYSILKNWLDRYNN